jgi:hypothetical protein
VLLEAAAALLQQAEVDLAGLVVDHDLAVEHRGAPAQRRGEDAGQLGELGAQVDAVAAGQHGRPGRGDPHRHPVAVQFVLIGPLRARAQPAAVRLGQHRLDPRGNGVVCHAHGDLRSRTLPSHQECEGNPNGLVPRAVRLVQSVQLACGASLVRNREARAAGRRLTFPA